MRTNAQIDYMTAAPQVFEDQYERPSFRPVNGTEELSELLGPGTKELIRLLNNL